MSHYGLKSKDYSDFLKSGPVVDELEQKSQGHRIASALHKTQVQLNAANTQVIANPSAVSKAPKVTKQIINTLLAPAKSLAELLGHLSEVVPQTEPVADLFKALLRLELDRQDNDKRIAVLYHSMSSMLIVLAKLDDAFAESELSEELDQKLDEIVKTMNGFGNFCDVFYKHRTVVRFIRGPEYAEELQFYLECFTRTRHDLETMMMHHTSLVVLQTSNVVGGIANEVSQLTKFMNAQTTREREAGDFIKVKGGVEAILKDTKIIIEVAAKLGDTINSSAQTNRALQVSLHADLNTQIQENYTVFILKLNSVKEELTETINKSTTEILMKLDAGPHELISDPDIKAIWKAVHHHFEQIFVRYAVENDGAAHPDAWTLNYLSRVIFYPAIADAIDEDSSGYVSVNELNNFFDGRARPPGWSVPQWLAYWAAGWYQDNLRYRDKILARLAAFENSIQGLHADNKGLLRDYLTCISADAKLIVNSLYNNVLEYFEDGSVATTELESLRDKYTEYITKKVDASLEGSKFELDDKRTLDMVVGVGNRLESVKPLPGGEGVTVAMAKSFDVIFDAFTRRTRSLMESWRQQRIGNDLQAEWYANGLFEDWYKREKEESEPDEYDDDDYLSDEYDTDPDQEEGLEEYADRPPTATGSMAGDTMEEARDVVEQTGHGYGTEDYENEDEAEYDAPRANIDANDDDDEDGDGGAKADGNESEHAPVGYEADREVGYPRALGTVHDSAVTERLDRLEEKMDELKDLLTNVLARLDSM
ncbi:hypothetical protein CTheo_1779 [Ceratobasidium theobromae]|uniref:EF-hand domain-containing protein n=1 Tax=Ceratobasidium theobromae TaxID=1582974 RepID=A0A5N5QST6_9AGAM|nr:hypothetical protein CTheo_1779 [Ceratobasidium theobromae]